jgi:hypothetical protein
VLNTDVVRYVFTILDAPIGSSYATGDVLYDGGTSSTTFTPDVWGTFRIQLTVYDDAAFSSTQIRSFIVNNSDAWSVVAFGSIDEENNFFDGPTLNERGWTEIQERAFRALFSGGGGGGSSRTTTLLWDGDQATDAAVGRYATFFEILTEIGTAEAPVEVKLVGGCDANVAGTYEWSNVMFTGNDPLAILTGSEGVVIRNAKFIGPYEITSTATTTQFLEFTGEVAYISGPTISGSSTPVGLITSTVAGAQKVRLGGGTQIGDWAFESVAATDWQIFTDNVSWEGTQQFIGSTGSIEYIATPNSYGSPGLDLYTGTYTNGTVLPVPPSSSALDANDLIYFGLADAIGTTSLINGSPYGSSFTLGTLTGTVLFETPLPTGDGMFILNAAYFEGVGTAKTYQPTVTNFTIHVWVKFMKLCTLGAGKVLLFGKESAAGATYGIGVAQDDGKLQAYIDTSVGGPAMYEGGFVDTGWNHIAITYDGANVVNYINSVPVLTTAKTGTLVYDNTKSHLAGNNADNGLVVAKDITFCDVPRSQAELKAIFKRGAFGT